MHFDAHHGHAKVVQKLIENDVAVISTTKDDETPLHLAVRAKQFEAFGVLIKTKNAPINVKDKKDQEPLHHAVRLGQIHMVSHLISNNAKVTTDNSHGWCPLHIAVAYGHLAVVKQLLAAKGVTVEDKLSSSSAKQDQTMPCLRKATSHWPNAGNRPLHLAAEYNQDETARPQVSKGAKVDIPCGWWPPHHAAFNFNITLVQLLITTGTNPHAVTNEGKIPLTIGHRKIGSEILDANRAIIQDLLENAAVSRKKYKGVTAFNNTFMSNRRRLTTSTKQSTLLRSQER